MDGMVGDRVDRAAEMYKNTNNPVTLRNRAQVGALFTGFEMVEPGVVFTPTWRPESPEDAEDPERSLALGGLGEMII
jgi:hypothetical protein